jgi:TrpR family transcriptional regulator, trp operon repressor
MSQDDSTERMRSFFELCSKIKTPKEFENLFSLFLTYEERETMASRYTIIKALLDDKLTQREIAEKYGVSIAQITRGSNALKIIDPNFKNFLKSID